MPFTRSKKVDENDVRSDVGQTKGNTAVPIKNAALPDSNRLALGEVGNLVKNIEIGAKAHSKQSKAITTNFKDVRPRVDSYWKKSGAAPAAPAANLRRINSTNTSNEGAVKLVTTKTIHLAKPEVAQKVTIKPDGRTKKNDLIAPRGPIKRQESILNRRSIPVLRKAIAQHAKVQTSLPESTVVNHSAALLSGIEDIDKHDAANPILESEYVKDIYAYLHELEKIFAIHPHYLDGQKDVTPKMRSVLIDWINEVHMQFRLGLDTYYLTVSIIDRFLQADKTTSRRNLQLVGVTAMFIASKYEEMYPPVLKDFVYITDDTYTVDQIIATERFMLKKLKFNLSPPLPIQFLRRFAKAAGTSDYEYRMSKYFIELASVDHSMVQYVPSAVAAAGIFMSLKVRAMPNKSNDKIWTPTMQYYTTHTLDHLRPMIRALAQLIINAPSAKEKSVFIKYKHNSFERVSECAEVTGTAMNDLCNF